MIKKSSIRRICVATLTLFILLIIYFFPSNDTVIKEHLSYITKDEMPIFLVDNSDYVARTSIVKIFSSSFKSSILVPSGIIGLKPSLI